MLAIKNISMPRRFLGTGLLLLFAGILACSPDSADRSALEEIDVQVRVEDIQKAGKIRVLTRNAPTTYYQGAFGEKGFEYDLINDFAAYLGVEVDLIIKDSVGEILQALENGEADLAAAGLTITPQREKRFLFGPPYIHVEQQVVCHRDIARPKTAEDLVGKSLFVINASSYVERLQELRKEVPALVWKEETDVSTEELLHWVIKRHADCVVADSTIVRINQRYFPELRVAFSLSNPQPLGWVMTKDATGLKQVIADWLQQLRAFGKLEEYENHYFEYVPIFDFVDIRAFHRRIESRLPNYLPMFQTAAVTHELPWELLAAQAYQESHWDPKAKSPTGVRGIMMLTRRTAKSLGVTSRLDPQQSIDGGAKYLANLIERVPDTVEGEDRLFYGLAAYNVGMGHIWDARKLARQLGKDPNSWNDIRETLPLLAKKKYYKNLKYGYARGWEPVKYVSRIRNYLYILNNELAVAE